MKNLWMASLFLMGCSGGGGGTFTPRADLAPSPDLRSGQNADLAMPNKPDLAMGESPDLAMGGGACTAEANYGALGSKKGGAQNQMDNAGNQVLTWQAPIDGQAKPNILSLELYGGAGAFANSKTIKTGTYQIAGDELNYATCGVCVLIYTKYDAQAMTIADSYMATGGTVKLTSVNGTLTGSISNATFEHVQIDPDTFESTPDPSMCMSALSSVTFSDTIQ